MGEETEDDDADDVEMAAVEEVGVEVKVEGVEEVEANACHH